jgi:hypothetical protein
MTSYIQLINKINAFCSAHYQVKRFGAEFGEQRPNLATESEQYPYVFMSPISGTPNYDLNQITVEITCYDIIQKDRANLNTIVSDCHLILTDLFGYYNQGKDEDIIALSASQSPLNNYDLDYVAGWSMTITFELEGWCTDAIPMSPIPSGGGGECESVTYSITDDEGTVLYSGTVASGGSLTQAISDATATLKDTAEVTISTTSINAEGSADIVAPDATYSNSDNSYSGNVVSGGSLSIPDITVTDSDGSTFTSPSVKNITCSPAAAASVENSDASYSTTVASGGSLSLPDSDVNVNGSLEGSVVSVKDVDINVVDSSGTVTPDSVSIVGNTVTIDVPDSSPAPVGATLMKTGQTTSYRTGDDGDIEAGRATDFFTLSTNNPFGNTNRFTDELGGGTYANNIVIDWSTYDTVAGTVLGWSKSATHTGVLDTWNNFIDSALIYSVGTYTTGWRLPNTLELLSIQWYGSSQRMQMTGCPYGDPFNISSNVFWSATSLDASNAQVVATAGTNQLYPYSKTSTRRALYCRTFTVSGTTLT